MAEMVYVSATTDLLTTKILLDVDSNSFCMVLEEEGASPKSAACIADIALQVW